MDDNEIAQVAAMIRATPVATPAAELERLLAFARQHRTCAAEIARIDGAAVLVPLDVKRWLGGWTIRWERARNRAELLEILGY